MSKLPVGSVKEIGLKIAAYAGGAIAGAVLAPVVAPAALGVIGFGAAGPVAGRRDIRLVPRSGVC